MNAFVILLALSTGIALATAVLSFFALLQVRQVARESRARTREMEGRMQAALKMTDAAIPKARPCTRDRAGKRRQSIPA